MGHITFMDRDDKPVWKKAPHGVYTPKLGYIALNIDLLQRELCWWWSRLWKINFPLKTKISIISKLKMWS